MILNNFTWVLDLISSEKGIYLMSCRFINCEDGITRVFAGVFCLLKGENETGFGGVLGRVRRYWRAMGRPLQYCGQVHER